MREEATGKKAVVVKFLRMVADQLERPGGYAISINVKTDAGWYDLSLSENEQHHMLLGKRMTIDLECYLRR